MFPYNNFSYKILFSLFVFALPASFGSKQNDPSEDQLVKADIYPRDSIINSTLYLLTNKEDKEKIKGALGQPLNKVDIENDKKNHYIDPMYLKRTKYKWFVPFLPRTKSKNPLMEGKIDIVIYQIDKENTSSEVSAFNDEKEKKPHEKNQKVLQSLAVALYKTKYKISKKQQGVKYLPFVKKNEQYGISETAQMDAELIKGYALAKYAYEIPGLGAAKGWFATTVTAIVAALLSLTGGGAYAYKKKMQKATDKDAEAKKSNEDED